MNAIKEKNYKAIRDGVVDGLAWNDHVAAFHLTTIQCTYQFSENC